MEIINLVELEGHCCQLCISKSKNDMFYRQVNRVPGNVECVI